MHFDFLGLFLAGLLTFASPCVLPLVPVYLSVLAGASVDDLKTGVRTAHVVRMALAFALGLTLVFIGLGLAASSLGRVLSSHRALLLQLGGIFVLLFGLKTLGIVRIPWLERDLRPLLRRHGGGGSLVSSLFFGAAFGLGWTPCIGPVLGSVLTYVASRNSGSPMGALYLGAYAAGLSVPLLVGAALAPLALHWHRRLLPHLRKLELATGALLVAVGLLLNTDSLDLIIPRSSSGLGSAASGMTDNLLGCAPAGTPSAATSPPASDSCATSVGTVAGAPPAQAVDSRAFEGIASVDGLRLIEFVSRSCPVCQRMVPVLRAAERDCAGAGVKIIQVDVDTPDGRAASRQLHVRGVPTLVFLDGSGVEVARLVGEQPLHTIEQSMAVLTGGRCDGFRALSGTGEGADRTKSVDRQGR